jgi:hypothetical protein
MSSRRIVLCFVALLLLVSGATVATARPSVERRARQDPSLHRVNGVWFHGDAAWSGVLTDRDPSSGERTETPIVDGEVHGVVKAWFANGARMYERRFRRGRESGLHEGWYADGRAHFRYEYANGVLEGEALEWYPNGAMYREFHYRAGHEEGAQRMWFPNGAARANYVMRDGRRFGLPGSKGCTGSDSTITQTAGLQ